MRFNNDKNKESTICRVTYTHLSILKKQPRVSYRNPKIEPAGGKLIGAYYSLSESEGIIITELPDVVGALTVSMRVGSTGVIAYICTAILILLDDAVKAAE